MIKEKLYKIYESGFNSLYDNNIDEYILSIYNDISKLSILKKLYYNGQTGALDLMEFAVDECLDEIEPKVKNNGTYVDKFTLYTSTAHEYDHSGSSFYAQSFSWNAMTNTTSNVVVYE